MKSDRSNPRKSVATNAFSSPIHRTPSRSQRLRGEQSGRLTLYRDVIPPRALPISGGQVPLERDFMIEWRMSDRDKESQSSRDRRKGREAELALCNEAVESGDYDLFTDKAWDKLCEQAVARGREAGQIPGGQSRDSNHILGRATPSRPSR